MLEATLLIAAVVFFALNLGGSGIAPSFASSYGAKLISRLNAVLLFSIFVLLGAFTFGGRVAKTLSSGLLDKHFFTPEVALVILVSAATSLFIANILKVPQSTSWVTVAATLGAAIFFRNLNLVTTFQMFGLWCVLPTAAFIITFFLFRIIYPPSSKNFWFYEKVHARKKEIRLAALASSCYVAFAIGASNVANAVGPLLGANLIPAFWGFLLISPLFGLGAWLIKDRTMKTMGEEIVPLGLITSTLVSCVTATLVLVAASLGFPQSLVQLNALAIMAVGSIKHEHVFGAKEGAVRKTFTVWLVAPIVSLIMSFLLLKLIIRG